MGFTDFHLNSSGGVFVMPGFLRFERLMVARWLKTRPGEMYWERRWRWFGHCARPDQVHGGGQGFPVFAKGAFSCGMGGFNTHVIWASRKTHASWPTFALVWLIGSRPCLADKRWTWCLHVILETYLIDIFTILGDRWDVPGQLKGAPRTTKT